ncbi:MAG TPA: hypothetical protein VIJ85_07980 [Rhizomicrobium sp.]
MSLFSRFSTAALTLGALLFASSAMACDNCGGGYREGGYYGGQQIYSCNNGLYDCRTESSFYQPRCDDGCYGYGYGGRARAYVRGYRHGYRNGFHDGYETASTGDDDRGFYDGDRHWHDWERWRDGDGHWRDGWHDGDGHWHDREADRHDGDGHDNHDGDHHDDHDGHDHHGDH